MLFYIIIILLSIMTNSSLLLINQMYNKWYFVIIMIILIPITFLLYILIYVLILSFISLFMKKDDKDNKVSKISNYLIKETSYIALKLLGIKIHVNYNNIDLPKEKILIVSNHRSNLDPLILTYFIKKFPIISVTKPENMYAPIYGKYVTKAGYVPIDREDDLKAVKAISQASKLISEDKSNVIIFPEGKRNHNEELLDFHAGSFKIALKSKCPLLLVSLYKTDMKKKIFRKKHIYIDLIKLYKKEDYIDNNTQKLANECRNLISIKYKERERGEN